MRATDAPAVRALIVSGLTERWGTYESHLNPDLEDFPAAYEGSTVLVAVCDRQIAGVGILEPTGPGSARIVRMSVAPGRRRQGIGTSILRELLRIASGQGLHDVTLETTASWESAVRFYERRGFVRTRVEGGDQHFALTGG